MALETLKGVSELGGFAVMQDRVMDGEAVDWQATDEQRKLQPIYIDHDVNMLSFRIQDGPVKENGVNGCQVDTLIHAARHIVGKLNENFPCEENRSCLKGLDKAIGALEARTANREKRGVEGTSQS
jgi:hypothetical protein